jgi:Ca2+-binding EF-hand superfamily protein
MKKLASALIILALFLSGTALAQPSADGKGKRKTFESCDKNNVGSLSFEEAKECYRRMSRAKFDAIDADNDGRITKDELKAHRAARKKHRASEQ